MQNKGKNIIMVTQNNLKTPQTILNNKIKITKLKTIIQHKINKTINKVQPKSSLINK